MYYGNRAKVYIPGWWEIRKMCKGLERLKPRVGITFDCDDSYKGAPDGEEKRLHLIADEDGVWMRRYDVWDDNKHTAQENAKRIEWIKIRNRGYKPSDQPEEKLLAHFDWKDVCGFSYDKSTDTGVSNVTTTQRVTATRVAVLGLFALAAPKTKKHYEYYDNGGKIVAVLHTTKGDIKLKSSFSSSVFTDFYAKRCRTFGKYVAKHAKAIPSQDQISHSVRL